MIRVFRIPFSTNVERVALAFGHKELEVDWVDVDPADRTPVEDVSGQDLVPVAVFEGGIVVPDSTAIIESLERRYPDPTLFPGGEAQAAEIRLFVDWFNRVWKRPPNLLVTLEDADHRRPGLIRELRESRDRFEALLAGRDHLFGDEFSAADCAAFPFLKYGLMFDPADDEPFHRILIEHLALEGRFPRLEAWLRRVDARPRG